MLISEWLQLQVVDLLREDAGSSSASTSASASASASASSFGLTLIGDRSTGVIIRSIAEGSPAASNGQVRVSDHVVQVGGINVRGMSANQVANLLRQCQTVRIVVARPFDAKDSDSDADGDGDGDGDGQSAKAKIIASAELDAYLKLSRETATAEGQAQSGAAAAFCGSNPINQPQLQPPPQTRNAPPGAEAERVVEVTPQSSAVITQIEPEPQPQPQPRPQNGDAEVARTHKSARATLSKCASANGAESRAPLRDDSTLQLLKLDDPAAALPSTLLRLQEMKSAKDDIIDRWRKIVGEPYEILIADIEKPTESAPLGISLEGVINTDSDRSLLHHQISMLHADGPAQRSGVLHTLDEILEVNGFRVYGLSHLEVIPFLKRLPCNVQMVVARLPGADDHAHESMKRDLQQPEPHKSDADSPCLEPHAHAHAENEKDESESESAGESQKQPSHSTSESSSSSTGRTSPAREPLPKAKSDCELDRHAPTARAQSLEPLCDLAMWAPEVCPVDLPKRDPQAGLGFSVMQHTAPSGRLSTLVRSLVPAGAADVDGRLKPGDKLLRINGLDVDGWQLDRVRSLLRTAPAGVVRLTVAKPVPVLDTSVRPLILPPPAAAPQPQTQTQTQTQPQAHRSQHALPAARQISLPLPASLHRRIRIKRTEKRLGISLDPVGYGVNGCLVTLVEECGCIGRDGRVHVNDFVVSLNNESLRNCTNAQVRDILHRASLLILTDLNVTYIKYADACAYVEHAAKIINEQNTTAAQKAAQLARARMSPRVFPKFYRPRLTPPPSPKCGSEAGRSLRSEPGLTMNMYDSASELGVSMYDSKLQHGDAESRICIMENGAIHMTSKGISLEQAAVPVSNLRSTLSVSNAALANDKNSPTVIKPLTDCAPFIDSTITSSFDSLTGSDRFDSVDQKSRTNFELSRKYSNSNAGAAKETSEFNHTKQNDAILINKNNVEASQNRPFSSEIMQSLNDIEFAWGPVRLVVLERPEGQSLGISIVGGRAEVTSPTRPLSQEQPFSGLLNSAADSPAKNACSGNAQSGSGNEALRSALTMLCNGIFVKNVIPSSPAGRCGYLRTGDCIIKVNDISLLNVTHNKAVEVLRKAANPVHIWVKSIIEATSITDRDAAVGSAVLPLDKGNKQ